MASGFPVNVHSAWQGDYASNAHWPGPHVTPAGTFSDWHPQGYDWSSEDGSSARLPYHCATTTPWGAQSFGACGWPEEMADPARFSFSAVPGEASTSGGAPGGLDAAAQPSTLPATRLSPTTSASGGPWGHDSLQGHGDPWLAGARELVDAAARRGLGASGAQQLATSQTGTGQRLR